jgi:hypothetical protein
MARTSTPWRLLPARELGCGSPATVWRRLNQSTTAGVFEALHLEILDRLGMAGRLDWSHARLDSTSIRAKHGGTTLAQTRSIAASRGPSSTWSATVVGCRSPRRSPPPTSPTWSCSPRSSTTSPVHTPSRRRRIRPGKLDADKGNDSAANRAWLRRRGITVRIARAGSNRRPGWGATAGGWSARCHGCRAGGGCRSGGIGTRSGGLCCAAGLRAHLLPAALAPSWSSSYRSCGTSRVCVKMRQSCHWSRAGSSASQERQCRGRRCSSW